MAKFLSNNKPNQILDWKPLLQPIQSKNQQALSQNIKSDYPCYTVTHLFVECVQASIFWSEFQNWILQLCNLQLVLSPQDVIYGIIRQLHPCLALNHLIILNGKYFLYVNALNNEKSSLIDFKILVQDKIQLEKYIAVTSSQQKLFFAKWQNFVDFCWLYIWYRFL